MNQFFIWRDWHGGLEGDSKSTHLFKCVNVNPSQCEVSVFTSVLLECSAPFISLVFIPFSLLMSNTIFILSDSDKQHTTLWSIDNPERSSLLIKLCLWMSSIDITSWSLLEI